MSQHSCLSLFSQKHFAIIIRSIRRYPVDNKSKNNIYSQYGCFSRDGKSQVTSHPSHVTPLMSPLSVRRTHMAVSAGRIDGTEENASNTCGLPKNINRHSCIHAAGLCQPVAHTWLCQPVVSMVNATYQHMLRLAVSAGNA